MKYVRWYDKNPDLKDIFDFLEGVDTSTQRKIAKDILQILMRDFNLDLDEEINNISKTYNFKCRRWYDNNIDLFTSFEIMKGLSKKLQREIIDKTVTSIILTILNKEAMNDGEVG